MDYEAHPRFDDVFTEFTNAIKRDYDFKKFNEFINKIGFSGPLIQTTELLLRQEDWFSKAVELIDNGKVYNIYYEQYLSGVEHARENNLKEAITAFNTSIKYASYPLNDLEYFAAEEEDEEESSLSTKDMAIVYANRAVVLQMLDCFDLAARDIDLCFKFGYPGSKNDLVIRKIACRVNIEVLALLEEDKLIFQDTAKKQDIINMCKGIKDSCLRESSDVELTTDEKVKLAKIIFEEVNNYSSLGEKATEYSPFDTYKLLTNGLQEYVRPDAREGRIVTPTPIFGKLADCLTQDGKIISAYNIIQSNEILHDSGFGNYLAILRPEYMSNHCIVCFDPVLAVHPCPACTTVIFCSEMCRMKAMLSTHRFQCYLLPKMIYLNMGDAARLTLHIVSDLGFVRTNVLNKRVKIPMEYPADEADIVEALSKIKLETMEEIDVVNVDLSNDLASLLMTDDKTDDAKDEGQSILDEKKPADTELSPKDTYEQVHQELLINNTLLTMSLKAVIIVKLLEKTDFFFLNDTNESPVECCGDAILYILTQFSI